MLSRMPTAQQRADCTGRNMTEKVSHSVYTKKQTTNNMLFVICFFAMTQVLCDGSA